MTWGTGGRGEVRGCGGAPAIRPVARLRAGTKHKAAGCKYTGEPQTCKRDSPRSAERQHQNLKFDASGPQQPAKERGDGGVKEGTLSEGGGGAWLPAGRRLAAGHDQLSKRRVRTQPSVSYSDESLFKDLYLLIVRQFTDFFNLGSQARKTANAPNQNG